MIEAKNQGDRFDDTGCKVARIMSLFIGGEKAICYREVFELLLDNKSKSKPAPAVQKMFEELDKKNPDYRMIGKYFWDALKATLGAKSKLERKLLWAAYNGSVKDIEALLKTMKTQKKEGLINTRNKEGKTPLLLAMQEGHGDVFKLLLEHGASVNMADQNDDAPLHLAIKLGNFEWLGELLDRHPNVNYGSRTPLMLVTDRTVTGEMDPYLIYKMAALLILEGAEINLKRSDGNTALHLAAMRGDANLVKLLLRHGAKSKIKNNKKQTAWSIASEKWGGHVFGALLLHKMEPVFSFPGRVTHGIASLFRGKKLEASCRA